MATKTKKATKKGNTPNVAKKVNASLINASLAAINTALDNGEKWQKLASKLLKKSENVRKQQINMIFDTAEAVKGQVMVGADRMKDLVGYDAELLEQTKIRVTNNKVSRKVVGIVEDITEKVSENEMFQKAEKTAETMKAKGMSKFNEVKGDVLKQASKIVNKAEAKLDEAKAELKKEAKKAAKTNPKTTTAAIKAKGAAKVKAVKKTTTVKKTQAKKAVTKKVNNIEAAGKAQVKAVKAVTKVAVKTIAKDDLKLIYGVGPKTELTFNNAGVKTYADLAKLEATEIEAILEKANTTFGATDAKDWKKQAEVAVKDGAEGLEKWVERYRTV